MNQIINTSSAIVATANHCTVTFLPPRSIPRTSKSSSRPNSVGLETKKCNVSDKWNTEHLMMTEKELVRTQRMTYIVPTKPFSSNSISVTQSSLLHVIPAQSHSLESLKKRFLPSNGNSVPQGSDPAAEHFDHDWPLVEK